MPKLRIASVGAGSEPGCRTWQYLAVIKQLDDLYDLCAVCDRDAGRAQAAAEAYGIPARHTDLEEMIRAEKPDVIIRLAPTDSCVGVCVRAAEMGCHVINEIPIAPTLPMADAIIDACRRNHVKLEIAENVWLWPQERLKQEIVRAGLIGRPVHSRLTYPCGSYHGINGIRMILGQEPRRAQGYAARAEMVPAIDYGGSPAHSSWWEAGVIEFADLACLYELPPKNRPWRRNWDIEGMNGALTGDLLLLYEDGREQPYPFESVTAEVNGQTVLEALRVNTDPPVEWRNPYARYGISDGDDIAKAAILESMYCAAAQDADPVYGWENARRDHELWVAVRESAVRGGEWVELPLREVTAIEERIHDEFRRRYNCDPVTDIDAQLRASYDRNPVMWGVAGWL